jgi:peptidoglycan/xylan/chitin deacetylase (PgdA/CDA1 family)
MEKLNLFNKERELYDNEFIFRQLFNIRPRFYRPPYFSYNSEVVDICNRFGYDIIVSNLNTDDWSSNSSEEIYNNFLDKWNNATGHIVLMHDYQTYNLVALEKIILFVKKNNYKFVSMSECIGMSLDYKYIADNTYGPNLLNGINI